MRRLHRLVSHARPRAVVWACLWALLAGQGLALWHARAHDPAARQSVAAQAQPAAAHDAFGHEVGAECSLLDHLLGLADGPAQVARWACPPASNPTVAPGCAQCTPEPLAAYAARAPPRG